jgi:phosphate transport system substrate-binding protein
MTVAELKKIWEPAAQGTLKTWKQVNAAWPDKPLKLYGPGADSGTFDYFTEAIVGKAKSSRGDFTASEDDNVLVQGVSNDEGGWGISDWPTTWKTWNLCKRWRWTAAKAESSLHGNGEKRDLRPLSRPIFIYVSKKAARRPEVKRYVEFFIKHATNS